MIQVKMNTDIIQQVQSLKNLITFDSGVLTLTSPSVTGLSMGPHNKTSNKVITQ